MHLASVDDPHVCPGNAWPVCALANPHLASGFLLEHMQQPQAGILHIDSFGPADGLLLASCGRPLPFFPCMCNHTETNKMSRRLRFLLFWTTQ